MRQKSFAHVQALAEKQISPDERAAALEVLKSIATGEYRAEMAKSEMISEGGPVESPEGQETASETESTTAANELEAMSEESPAQAQENPTETEAKSE